MAYQKQNWANGTSPKISADNLNHMEDGIYYAVPIGGMMDYGGTIAPDGWLICDGSAVSRETYSDLFNVIGTYFGVGDGSTTFNLPPFNGRIGIGLDPNDTDFDTLGKTVGEKNHTLTIEEIPPHKHGDPITNGFGNLSWGYKFEYTNTANLNVEHTQSVGGGQAHNNMQPSVVVNKIIKY